MLVSGLPLDLWYATSMLCVCRYFPTFLCCVVTTYMWDRLVSVTDRGGVPDSRQKAACRVVCEPQCSDWGQSLELYWIKFTWSLNRDHRRRLTAPPRAARGSLGEDLQPAAIAAHACGHRGWLRSSTDGNLPAWKTFVRDW